MNRADLASEQELSELSKTLDFMTMLRLAAVVGAQEALDAVMAQHLAAQTGESVERVFLRLHSVSNQLMIESVKRWSRKDALADEN